MSDHLLLENAGPGAGTNLHSYRGGVCTVLADGNFGTGGTVILEWRGLDGSWYPVPDVSFTAADMKNISFGAGIVIRGNVSAGTGTAINLQLTSTF